MIFITTGTELFPFTRLVNEIITISKNDSFKSNKFHFQYNNYNISLDSPKNITFFNSCNYNQFINYVLESDIVITHAGLGSLITILNQNKIPLVVARNKIFGEHIDNHQIEIAKELSREKKIIYVEDLSELEVHIIRYGQLVKQCTKSKQFQFSKISEYINKNFLKDPVKKNI